MYSVKSPPLPHSQFHSTLPHQTESIVGTVVYILLNPPCPWALVGIIPYVSWCHNKAPQIDWLKTTAFSLLQLWRLEIQNQGVRRPCFL